MIVFVVDVEDGITPMDKEVANLLRQVDKPLFMNLRNIKMDNNIMETRNINKRIYIDMDSIC